MQRDGSEQRLRSVRVAKMFAFAARKARQHTAPRAVRAGGGVMAQNARKKGRR